MKGMHNNAAAMGLLQSMTTKNESRIREIYNMGYNQGYRDGLKESVERIVEYVEDEIKGEGGEEE
jgi:hypothetical protein